MLMTPEQALRIVLTHTHPLDVQTLRLYEAHGYCLAEAVYADRPMPPTHRSAMDGYALRVADIEANDGVLRIIGEAAIGRDNASLIVKSGTCMPIFTGAVIPKGADAVVKIEDTQMHGNRISICNGHVRIGDNIRKKGEEYKKNHRLLPKGTVLDAAEIALCASVGAVRVRVYRKPRVTILCSGNEVVAPEQAVQPWQLRDTNGPALEVLVRQAGGSILKLHRIKDRPAIITQAFRAALEHSDIIISSGGVSAGQYDYIPSVVETIGATLRFHKLSVKPGKPVLYATVKENVQIFGLPGNPLGALNNFFEFVLPAMRRMQGYAVKDCQQTAWLPLSKTLLPKGNRMEYVPVKVRYQQSGAVLEPVEFHGSADIYSVTGADGMAILPREPEKCQAGCHLAFRAWRPIW